MLHHHDSAEKKRHRVHYDLTPPPVGRIYLRLGSFSFPRLSCAKKYAVKITPGKTQYSANPESLARSGCTIAPAATDWNLSVERMRIQITIDTDNDRTIPPRWNETSSAQT
ncbi:hypothetical protein R1flu_005966 [Riccia fluitans]|uniref:Uncharacterized protein n=1 Tax=Riccia fluitans TaxID=41844 RepID=A0ABD1YUN5_9MARC